jgi:hypothetical protein
MNTQITELNGFAVGDYALVKSGSFKGARVLIHRLYIAQYVNMKEPKAYAYVTFPGGNAWDFQTANLRKDIK